MARTTATAPRRRGIPLVPTATLALWRLRQTWRLLLVSGLGALAAVMLVCAVPLFSQVAMSAGLRAQLAQLGEGPLVVVGGETMNPSSGLIAQEQPRIDRVVRGEVGAYLTSAAPAVSTLIFDINVQSAGNISGQNGVDLLGADMTADTSAYTLVSGRLPSRLSRDLEVAISRDMAARYGLTAGMNVPLAISGSQGNQPLTVAVVGILAKAPTNPFTDVSPTSVGLIYRGLGPVYVGSGGFGNDTALVSNDTLIAVYSRLASQGLNPLPLIVQWTYHLDLARLSVDTLGDLTDHLQALQFTDTDALNANSTVNLNAFDTVTGILREYQGRVIVAQIPVGLLLIQVIGLVLLFISLMVNILVDRQAEAIAVLRSRGASRNLVLRTMTVQSIGVGLLALIAGPLLALALVGAIAGAALPPDQRGALNLLSSNPLAAAWSVRWFALATAVCAIVAMIVSTRKAAGNNVLALRRESARVRGRPLWQRLNLDLVFAAIAVLGYTAYTYIIANVGGYVRPFLSVLSLVAMLFLMLAVALLFLRFFPLLLRLLARIAAGRRNAAPMLAIGQMARAPKQASRMTLLLALSTAFTLFALIFAASQAQRVRDVALYQTGADFRGSVSPTATGQNAMSELSAKYGAIPGVTSATPVYDTQIYGPALQMELLAVDADTFAHSAIWTAQDAADSLDSLMATLASQRGGATDAVPAVVDDVTWRALKLTPGAGFTFAFQQNGAVVPLRFRAVAHVQHIPPINDGSDAPQGYGSGGLLVDFATLNAIYISTSSAGGAKGSSTATPLTPNGIWLRTADDAASLASVRKALSSGSLALGSLQDTRVLIDNQRNNPLQIEFANTLLIGAVTALLLALIGIWVGSWLNARGRLVNFAVLRALGVTPRQMRGMLVWEQAIIYLAGIALGIALGWILSLTALPMLIFVELATTGNFQRTPNVPPARVVIPGATLGLGLGALVVICILALILTMVALARLSLGQTLRLNED
ncbi:MAG: FtsX-like permease family protein [Chloroflexota bacterium]|nr:FtsX-like permease family protein [Chloroflexota bacterium]